jgi:hypothetical protein
MDTTLVVVNVIMLTGIVLALLAIRPIKKGTEELRLKNQRRRERMQKVYSRRRD